tara:strand:+ start:17286 stop:18410 length:1125 start_codon:yes stop_codon:yes gene_type:complete
MSNRFHLGTRKGLFTFERSSTGKWAPTREHFLGDPVPMLFPDARDGNLYVVLEHGHFGTKLHRSEDEGANWKELDPPVYPPKPDDVPETIDPFRNTPVPWSLEKIWALESAGDDQPGALWCGTLPGGLFRSEDRGESWEMVRSLWDRPERAKWAGGGYDVPGIHSICVHPNDSKDVIVAISCGGVWRTRDGGETWKQCAHGMFYDFNPEEREMDPDSQDPHRVVRCEAAPDQLWSQHHCGIFRSTDDCTSWQYVENVQPAGFGFAVAVHPKDPLTAWFVPARKDEMRYPVDGKFLVNRTRDGGKTFVNCSNGLPEGKAYDLVYRHALEVDESGERLVMGSTTGSVWISEDGGDSWEILGSHFPPVYCARFDRRQ